MIAAGTCGELNNPLAVACNLLVSGDRDLCNAPAACVTVCLQEHYVPRKLRVHYE
jgi:hypothetical protein